MMYCSPRVLLSRELDADLCGKDLSCYPLGHEHPVSAAGQQQPIANIKCLKCHPADFLFPGAMQYIFGP